MFNKLEKLNSQAFNSQARGSVKNRLTSSYTSYTFAAISFVAIGALATVVSAQLIGRGTITTGGVVRVDPFAPPANPVSGGVLSRSGGSESSGVIITGTGATPTAGGTGSILLPRPTLIPRPRTPFQPGPR